MAAGSIVICLGQSDAMNFGNQGVSYSAWVNDPQIRFWDKTAAAWVTYDPFGTGTGATKALIDSSGTVPGYWGPEAEYARQFRLIVPQQSIWVFHYAIGTTPLGQTPAGQLDWNPYSFGVNKQFDIMKTDLMAALNAMIVLGVQEIIVETCLWIGNESDTVDPVLAGQVWYMLVQFRRALRGVVGRNDMRFIIARCRQGAPNGPYTQTVRSAQEAVGTHFNSAWVTTDDLVLGGPGNLHFDAPSTVKLGSRMFHADQTLMLTEKQPITNSTDTSGF
jgi:hypothetical protein